MGGAASGRRATPALRGCPARAAALGLTALLAAGAAQGALDLDSTREAGSLDHCEALLRQRRTRVKGANCFWHYSSFSGARGATLSRLEALLRQTPGEPALFHAQALVSMGRDLDDVALFHQAADGFAAQGDAVGEVVSRVSADSALCWQGRFAEGAADLERAAVVAAASGEPELPWMVQIFAGRHAQAEGDHGRAAVIFAGVRGQLFPGGQWWLKYWLLDGQAQTFAATGRHREAFDALRAQVEVLEGLDLFQAIARTGVAREAVLLAEQGELPWDEADGLLRAALEQQERTGAPQYLRNGALSTRLLLAQRLGPTGDGIALLEQALAGARRAEIGPVIAQILPVLARFRAAQAPAAAPEALAFADEAIAEARELKLGSEIVQGLLARAWVRFRVGDREAGTRDALAALDELERLRVRQRDPLTRGQALGEWAFAAALITGWVLGDVPAGTASPRPGVRREDVALAFAVGERMRARALADQLDAAGAWPRRELDAAGAAQRDAVLLAIARLQRRLLDPALTPAERRRDLDALGRLEAEEDALRDRLVPPPPTAAGPPTLAEVQSSLGDDEALVTYQLGQPRAAPGDPFHAPGSFALVVTRRTARAFAVPDTATLERRVEMLTGLLDRRDGQGAEAAARLYDDLLREPLAALERPPRRLVLVPDGPLHRLPFGALRAGPAGPHLAAATAISIAPSAALLLRWRAGAGPAGERALVLADPLPASPGPGSALDEAPSDGGERGALSLSGLRLGALPNSRVEAKAVAGLRGAGAVLRLGSDASERFLKQADLRPYGVLHLAAHALLDERRPERSALVLAPGAEEEDGLLQLREVAALDLRGKLVVLAACSSASGKLLRGEGPLSLARAFFEAGARAVLASLWPLRDDEAARAFAAFYDALDEGLSATEALAQAQRRLARDGLPPAAWAGLQLFGDGWATPWPSRTQPRAWHLLASLAALAAALATALAAGRRRRWKQEP